MKALVLKGMTLGAGGPLGDVAVVDGSIAAIGPSLTVHRSDEVMNWPGGAVLPGFVDSHVHSAQWASQQHQIDVSSATSPQEAVELLTAALGLTTGRVVMGHGFRDAMWTQPFDGAMLQAAFPDVPVALISADLHTLWASPAALALVDTDAGTGVVREQEGMTAHRKLAAVASPQASVDRWVVDAVGGLSSRGITGIVDFECADNAADWTRRAATRGLDVRVKCCVWPPWLDAAIAAGRPTGAVLEGTGGLVSMGFYKLFADGSLNSRTAWCHDSYPEGAGNGSAAGLPLLDLDQLVQAMGTAVDGGLVPAVHAIGDRAVTTVLDAFEHLGCGGRIEHAQMVRPKDLPRFADLGVTASIQPQHVVADRDVADRYWADRTDRAFPYRDFYQAGTVLRLGSDAPVSQPLPLQAVADAVLRTDDGRLPWHPEQSLPLDVALAAASGGRGSLRVGDPADLIVLAADPAAVPVTELAHLPVEATWLDGRMTHLAQS